MATIGEIRVFAFDFAPPGWLPCDGRSLQTSGYEELFAAIGVTYGGNATNGTFNLPDLRSRVMMNIDPEDSQISTPGVTSGAESAILVPESAPPHSHSFNIGSTPNSAVVEGASIAQSVAMNNPGTVLSFSNLDNPTTLNITAVGNTGTGAAHENRMSSLALNVCIAASDQAQTEMPYVGEIRPFAFSTCPDGWLACNGSKQSVFQYEALVSLLGITFGGDGQTTFGLPDLTGTVVVANGQGTGLSSYTFGQSFGSDSVSLTADEMPTHNHKVVVNNDTAVSATVHAQYTYLAAYECPVEGSLNAFIPANLNMETQVLNSNTIGMGAGGSHENRQPFLAINYLISSAGFYPPRPGADTL